MRRATGFLTGLVLLLSVLSAPAGADEPRPPARPFGERVVKTTGYATGEPYDLRVPHRVKVLMPVNLGDYPYTAEQAAAAIDGVLAWWRAAVPSAFVSLTRVAAPIPYVATTNPGPPRCAMDTGEDLDEIYAASGGKPDRNDGIADHVVVLLPPACGRGGLGGTGGMPNNVYSDGWSYVAPQELSNLPLLLTHELGHNFGFNHANTLCGDGCPFGPPTQVMEYGDCYAVMGSTTGVPSTAARAQGGLLEPGEMASLDGLRGGVDRSLVLQPRSATAGQRGLSLTDPETGQTWYLDYRSDTGLDTVLGPPACPPGITVTTIGVQRSTVLHPRPGMAIFDHAAASHPAGDSFQLSPDISVTVGQLDPVAGAQLQVHIRDLPPFVSAPRIRLAGMKGLHGVAKVRLGTFKPRAGHLSYRWYLDGRLLRDLWGDPDGSQRMQLPWQHGRLVAEVTAYAPGHRPVVVRTPAARVLPILRLPRPRIRGELRVGQLLRLTFRHPSSLPRRLKVDCTWRVGNVQQPTHGQTLRLTPRMAHLKIQVTVRARAKGYRWTQALTNTTKGIQP
jgi:hypothetical protein